MNKSQILHLIFLSVVLKIDSRKPVIYQNYPPSRLYVTDLYNANVQ